MDQAEVQLLLQLVFSENVKSKNVTPKYVTSHLKMSHLNMSRHIGECHIIGSVASLTRKNKNTFLYLSDFCTFIVL